MIGWYVHHHGWGHVARLLAVRPHLDDAVTVFSSMPRPASLDDRTSWVQLPSDADPVVGADGVERPAHELGDVTAGGALHWAPVGHPGHRRRLAIIADWIARTDVAAFVVDVSAEVTAFVRLLGVPTVVFAQPGDRTDAPHRLAYDLADRIVAPWAGQLIAAPGLEPHDERVHRVGAISRHAGRPRPADSAPGDERRVLFLGRTLDARRLDAVIDLLTADGWEVETAGARDDDRVEDVWPLLVRATVVVGAAGQNGVADLAAAAARSVVVVQERPFDEQEHTGRALRARGLAQVAAGDASPAHILDLVRRAAASTPSWDGWQVHGSAARAAAVIDEVRV